MKKVIFKLIALTFSLMALLSCSDDDHEGDIINEDPTTTPMFSINAKGTVTGKMVENFKLPGTDLSVAGNAFEMTMYNPVTGESMGTVIDINVGAETFEDGSMFGENYTIFLFDDAQNSTLVLHNLIDMIPAPPANMNAFIKKENTTDNVVSGTGIYSGFAGGSTLNATLDMSAFAENTVGFDCLYGFTQILH
jgi:hypothetical protein